MVQGLQLNKLFQILEIAILFTNHGSSKYASFLRREDLCMTTATYTSTVQLYLLVYMTIAISHNDYTHCNLITIIHNVPPILVLYIKQAGCFILLVALHDAWLQVNAAVGLILLVIDIIML